LHALHKMWAIARRSSVVILCVCLSVTFVSPAKTAELIKMPFGIGSSFIWSKEPCIRT